MPGSVSSVKEAASNRIRKSRSSLKRHKFRQFISKGSITFQTVIYDENSLRLKSCIRSLRQQVTLFRRMCVYLSEAQQATRKSRISVNNWMECFVSL